TENRVRYAETLKASRPMRCKNGSASDSVRERKKGQMIHVKMKVPSTLVRVHSEGQRLSPPGTSVALSVWLAGRKVPGRIARPLRPPHNKKFQEAPCQKPLRRNVIMTLHALRQDVTCRPPMPI